MHIEFTATTLFAENEEDVAYFSLMDGGEDEPENILIFQTLLPSTGEVGDIHFEYNDQSNGAYGAIASCRLGRGSLHITLQKQLGELEGVDGFDIQLELDDDIYAELADALALIFADNPLFELVSN